MKFRTDFVTNSSSTSYISVVVEYMDGRKTELFNESEDSGEYASTLKVPKENFEKVFSAKNFADLKKAYEELYKGTDAPYLWQSEKVLSTIEKNKIDFDIVKCLEIRSYEHYPNDDDFEEPIYVQMQIIKFEPQSERISCEVATRNIGEEM